MREGCLARAVRLVLNQLALARLSFFLNQLALVDIVGRVPSPGRYKPDLSLRAIRE